MITLYIESIDRFRQFRSFTCQLNELETALETLSLIAAAGNHLVEISIVEDGKRTHLSPQAFDGQDLLRPIRALQRQWEDLLRGTREDAYAKYDLPLIMMTLQRIDQFETRMAEYDCSITQFEQLVHSTRQQLREGNYRERLISRYQTIINRQQQYMAQAVTGRDACLRKLTKLKQSS